MPLPVICDHEETLKLLAEAERCAAVMEQGRTRENAVFASKYTARFRTPKLPSVMPLVEEEPDPHQDEVDKLIPGIERDYSVSTEYKGRRPSGHTELQKNFMRWLRSEFDIKEGEEIFTPTTEFDSKEAEKVVAKGNAHCFTCEGSINSNLLPQLFSGSLFKPHDEVLYCTPIYSMIPSRANKLGLNILAIRGVKENHYKPNADDIEKALKAHPDARSLLLVNPGNPMGTFLSEEEIGKIAHVIKQHNNERIKQGKRPLFLVVDETFQSLLWHKPGAPYTERERLPHMAKHRDLRNCTITISTFSKDLSPDHTFAYAYGNPSLIKQMEISDGQNSQIQEHASAVFSDNTDSTRILKQHHDINASHYRSHYAVLAGAVMHINDELRKTLGGKEDFITFTAPPAAGFHVSLDFSKLAGLVPKGESDALQTSANLAEKLMNKEGLVAYPGEMFHMDGKDMILRFSLNMKMEKVKAAMERLEIFCLSLEPPGPWAGRTAERPGGDITPQH